MSGNGTDEIKVLFPEETITLESGEQVEVRPVPFGQLHKFSQAIGNIFKKVKEAGLTEDGLDNVQVMLDVALEEVQSMMLLVLGKEDGWLDGITINDGVILLELIFKQNIKEETKKKFLKAIEGFTSLLPIQHSILSKTVTDGETSKDTP